MWQHREIPEELGWTILFLTPKGNANTRGVRLLKTLWKVVGTIIDTFMSTSISSHEVLHGFCAGRGMEITILDLKLAQELASVNHDALFLVFLDLRKS